MGASRATTGGTGEATGIYVSPAVATALPVARKTPQGYVTVDLIGRGREEERPHSQKMEQKGGAGADESGTRDVVMAGTEEPLVFITIPTSFQHVRHLQQIKPRSASWNPLRSSQIRPNWASSHPVHTLPECKPHSLATEGEWVPSVKAPAAAQKLVTGKREAGGRRLCYREQTASASRYC